MWQVQAIIGKSLPVSLVCLSNGCVAFIITDHFSAIIDQPDPVKFPDGIEAVFTQEGFTLGKESFMYNQAYEYKSIEVMLKYLMQQQMSFPQGLF